MWRKKKSTRSIGPSSSVDIRRARSFQEVNIGRRYESNFRNPVHVEPFHIPDIFHRTVRGRDSSIMISPKADGVPKALEIVFDDRTLVVLHVERVGNNYLVIDLLKMSNIDVKNMSFEQRLSAISKISHSKVLWSVDLTDQTSLEDTLHRITNSIEPIDLDDQIGLIIKPVLKISLQSDQSEIDAIKFGKLCSDLLTPYVTTDNSNKFYPNDGWILYRNYSQIPIKFKPYSHLTLDVRYDGIKNDRRLWSVDLVPLKSSRCIMDIGDTEVDLEVDQIYRCDPPISSESKWDLVERRDDKVFPNRYDHYQSLVSRCSYEIQNGISCESMMDLYARDYGENYYDGDGRRENRTSYQDLQATRVREAIKFMIELSHNQNDGTLRVLDIGSGSCNMYSKIVSSMNELAIQSYVEYYGIDTDPIILSVGADRNSKPIRVWGTMSGDTGLEEYYSNYFQNQFDFSIVTLVNSIHYSDNLTILFSSIVDRINSGYVLIFSMFSDLIDTKFDNNSDPNLSIVRLKEKYYEFKYPWKTSSFNEGIYSTGDLEEAVHLTPQLSIDPITDELNKRIHSDTLDFIAHERSFLEIHRCYVLKIG
jgi:SAM-dependent methyltransferase